MSQQSPEDSERPGQADPWENGRVGYVLTEKERMAFMQCSQESFWYRSLPMSVISIAVTQALISKGILTATGRFGPLPKLVFAGFFGYLGGKLSYMRICIERLRSSEDSPLGEALRQHQQRRQPPMFADEQLESSDSNKADFKPAFQFDDKKDQSFSYSRDFTYSDPISSEKHYDPQSPAEPSYVEEEVKKKYVLYEELRNKNRENYEVTMTPKPKTWVKPSEETVPVKRGKQNIYGDTWEE